LVNPNLTLPNGKSSGREGFAGWERAGGLRKQQAEKNEEEDARSSESAIAEVLFCTRV
jgi:hypothetical protein